MDKVHLFYDPNHPTNVVIGYIATKAFERLAMEPKLFHEDSVPHMDTFELPIYVAVQNALKLKFSKKYIRCYNGLKLKDDLIDLKEYVRQYI